jgi:hypothetical protein
MKRLRWSSIGLIGLGIGCGSDPSYEPVYGGNATRSTSALDKRPDLPRANTTSSVEAPRMTIAAMQVCADRFAPKLPGESFAVMYDVNIGAHGNVVKIKDSMLDGSPLEHCLATALEQMDTSMVQANVAPQSRGMIGVVQTLAAPVALAPIALVAAGVTIVVGATLYLGSEALKERERCKQVKAECLADCSIDTLHQGRREPAFSVCMRKCLEKENCW